MDNCLQQASALSFVSLLSLIPFTATLFAILKGLGVQYSIQEKLLVTLTGNQTEIVNILVRSIENVNGKAMGAIGILFLLVTVFSVLSTVERAFNSIWSIQTGRTLTRKITDYFSIVFLSPFIAVLSISVTSYIQLSPTFKLLEGLQPYLAQWGISITTYLLTIIALTTLYVFMPNTKVRWSAGLMGGIIGGLLWQALQINYLNLSLYFRNIHVIYQGFAQVPLFFLWIYGSWLIILYGAEFSFAIQNRKTYFLEIHSRHPSLKMYYAISSLILETVHENLKKGNGPTFIPDDISREYTLPIRLLINTVDMLEKTAIVKRIHADKQQSLREYMLIPDPYQISSGELLDRLLTYTQDEETSFIWKNMEISTLTPAMKKLEQMLENMKKDPLNRDH